MQFSELLSDTISVFRAITERGADCKHSFGSQPSLISGNNLLMGCEIRDWSRWKRTYQPGISWSGVSNNYTHNSVYNAPHAGILGWGLYHTVMHFNPL